MFCILISYSDGLVIVGVHSAKFPNEKVSVFHVYLFYTFGHHTLMIILFRVIFYQISPLHFKAQTLICVVPLENSVLQSLGLKRVFLPKIG